MKTVILVTFVATSLTTMAQDAVKTEDSSPEIKRQEASPSTEKPSQEALEAKFIETMTNATMSGRWCLIKDNALTPEKEDKYTIVSVKKNDNGFWMINSRIEYGGFNMVVPVPVKMEWAGDTPVIVVDNMGIPGGNKYSARVLVYEDSYAGTWSGPGLQGLLNGMITRTPIDEAAVKKDAPKSEADASESR